MSEREVEWPERVSSASPEQVRYFIADGLRWAVREVPAPLFDRRRGGTHLLFDGELVMRRLRVFPADWYSLSDDALYELSQHIDR